MTGGEKDRARTSTKTQRRSQSRCLTSTSDPYRNPLTMIRGGRRRRWSIFLNPALDGQQSAVDGADQCGVVGFGLIGVAPRELAQCLVDPVGARPCNRRSSRRRWSWRAPWRGADPPLRRSQSARPHRLRLKVCVPSCFGTVARSTAGRPSWSTPVMGRSPSAVTVGIPRPAAPGARAMPIHRARSAPSTDRRACLSCRKTTSDSDEPSSSAT